MYNISNTLMDVYEAIYNWWKVSSWFDIGYYVIYRIDLCYGLW